jgi:hypothetical protein
VIPLFLSSKLKESLKIRFQQNLMQKSFLNLQPVYSKDEYKANSKLYELLDIIPVLEKNDFDYIYRPNDDSYLFIDTLFMELKKLAQIDNLKIAEIGCGSGFLVNNLVN